MLNLKLYLDTTEGIKKYAVSLSTASAVNEHVIKVTDLATKEDCCYTEADLSDLCLNSRGVCLYDFMLDDKATKLFIDLFQKYYDEKHVVADINVFRDFLNDHFYENYGGYREPINTPYEQWSTFDVITGVCDDIIKEFNCLIEAFDIYINA